MSAAALLWQILGGTDSQISFSVTRRLLERPIMADRTLDWQGELTNQHADLDVGSSFFFPKSAAIGSSEPGVGPGR